MTIIIELLFALIFAAIGSFSILLAIRRARAAPRPPMPIIWMTFILMWLTTWALGAWLAPIGPSLGGAHWLSYLVVALILTLLLMGFAPIHPANPRAFNQTPPNLNAEPMPLFGITFWVVVIVLLFFIIGGSL